MAKRFIDTGLFDDEWFMNLSQEAKLLWIYFITRCNHAGILKLNLNLCHFQTGINDLITVIKELGNRIVTVSEHLYFIPKFIEYQYPGFPNSKVRQQQSAVDILIKYGLFDKGIITVSKELAISHKTINKELADTYDNDNDIGNVIDNDNVNVKENVSVNIEFDVFWDLYDKKVGDKTKLTKKWNHLTDSERKVIIDYIPRYIKSQPDKHFRKNPETFLNNKSWNDEIISSLKKGVDRAQRPGQIIVDGTVKPEFKTD